MTNLSKCHALRNHKAFTPVKSVAKSCLKSEVKTPKPEIKLRKALWSKNIRYRIHQNELPGTPDIVIKKYKLAIFVDGEFWHGYNWKEARENIKSNQEFWIPKIERNIQKDFASNKALRDLGYTVF
ncbi:very short patch repair endonuclease [Sphingobacterium daejeonense]|uniref:very short patch repair endonuclease n=1 Tax=Sphingobacterium daejeonense TaxID=371142 RepID=UPI0010C26C14|nr:very short patch repair endonuclease [Sphingobacterium daejeonense]VTP93326.1 Very short patch repair protein [Sphingobacterium daejeonense]